MWITPLRTMKSNLGVSIHLFLALEASGDKIQIIPEMEFHVVMLILRLHCFYNIH
jgi:hypothetical protein